MGTALAFGLATMAWPYARYLFSESLAGLGLMLCAYFLLRYRDRGDSLSPLLAGAGLGLALLARLNNAIVAPFLGLLLLVYLLRHSGRLEGKHADPPLHGPSRHWCGCLWQTWIQPVVLFGLPVLVALAVANWYNWLRFGNPLTTGYLAEESFTTPFFEGLYGLTFSPGKGLFWYNPLFLAALLAWPTFFRRHRAEALLVAAVVLSNVAFYAPWYLWWAGHGWGPRFLVTALPFAALPLAPAWEAARQRRSLAAGFAALTLLSVVVQILAVAVNFNLYLEEVYAELGLYHPATLFDPAYSPLLRQIAYLRPETLDLAWARGGTIDCLAFLVGIALILVSGLTTWVTWRGRPGLWGRGPWGRGLLLLFGALGTIVVLLRFAPSGDVAQGSAALAMMERPDEAAILIDPTTTLTEPFQDAYDGRLWVWGVSSQEDAVGVGSARPLALWVIGTGRVLTVGAPEPATAHFQAGTLRLDFYPAAAGPFDAARLPVAPLAEAIHLGEGIQLVAVQLGDPALRPGETLSVALYWRALAPMDTSYTVFVQAIEAGGSKAGQVDRLPCDGDCPTTGWRPGDLIGERYDLPIRADAPPGRYQLIAGLYDLATGENLPCFDAQGHPIGDFLSLGWLQIE